MGKERFTNACVSCVRKKNENCQFVECKLNSKHQQLCCCLITYLRFIKNEQQENKKKTKLRTCILNTELSLQKSNTDVFLLYIEIACVFILLLITVTSLRPRWKPAPLSRVFFSFYPIDHTTFTALGVSVWWSIYNMSDLSSLLHPRGPEFDPTALSVRHTYCNRFFSYT